jgi:DNA topoisomerase-1
MPRKPKDKQAQPEGGLRYSNDAERGLRREGDAKAFSYRDAKGVILKDEKQLERIRKLGIPPAWTDVWICADDRGHLQATGRDAKGRKQYRYHAAWRETREADKFGHLEEFARALPAIRRRVRADLALPGLPRRKVLAAIVRLLESTCIRIGNERYAEQNESYGLTTMRNRHVRVNGARVQFNFKGKSGKFHKIAVDDPRLARIIEHCRDLPGQELFQYLDEEGNVQSVGSQDVNEYLREAAGREVSTKNFRTWAGSLLRRVEARARRESRERAAHRRSACAKRRERLGNTPAICRKSYVHPRVLDPLTWQGDRAASATRRTACASRKRRSCASCARRVPIS